MKGGLEAAYSPVTGGKEVGIFNYLEKGNLTNFKKEKTI